MRTSLVAGNWKMHLTGVEGAALVENVAHQAQFKTDVDIVVCPSFVALSKVREACRNTPIKLGAQNVFWLEKGAFTGNISPTMLRECGVDYCIVGHSETRGRFGKLEVPESTVATFAETDETVNLKLRALLYHSITPILCVGETLGEREEGRTDAVIREQLLGALKNVDPVEMYLLVVAYEPVWAIGTGKTCDADEAERICAMIRGVVGELAGDEIADQLRVLYGGSVKGSNSDELFAKPNIDGGLVGGASLNVEEFARIIMSA